MHQLRASEVLAWRTRQAERVRAGEYAPTTINGWIAVLRVIARAAKNRFPEGHDWMAGVRVLDTSEHETYSFEEPNSLRPAEVAPFIKKFRELYPQHFAMFYVGLKTGLRPSSLRPLRRAGAEVDVVWSENRLHVRRSHTHGLEVMKTTKQKRRYSIGVPESVISVLRWHIETQLRTDEQRSSDLLFPSENGGFRSQKILNAPLAQIAAELGIARKFTQRGLRRTYHDEMRANGINDVVIRSISGHQTESDAAPLFDGER
jgi:integrase